MSGLSIKGNLTKINNIENIVNKEGKKWVKQTFVINTGSQYNNEICFQLFGEDKIQLISQLQTGDQVEVFFNVSSKEYNNRYYHNIDAWRIIKINDTHHTSNDDEAPF
tara:strand:- start:74 stop:397 length:324 start_codon:yes stop_codon:yes gene_type:complete